MSDSVATSSHWGGAPPFNALTHGLRSGSTLLPGDNVAAFRTLRQRLFRLHQPRTVEEALCVETITVCHWRIARCRLEYAGFKSHLGAALASHPATTASVSGQDPHRLYHRGSDCVLEEGRLERQKSRAQATLGLLQQQRTRNLLPAGAAALEDYTVFLVEGEPPADDAAPQELTGAAEPVQPDAAATPTNDTGNGENRKRTAAATSAPQPVSPTQGEGAQPAVPMASLTPSGRGADHAAYETVPETTPEAAANPPGVP